MMCKCKQESVSTTVWPNWETARRLFDELCHLVQHIFNKTNGSLYEFQIVIDHRETDRDRQTCSGCRIHRIDRNNNRIITVWRTRVTILMQLTADGTCRNMNEQGGNRSPGKP